MEPTPDLPTLPEGWPHTSQGENPPEIGRAKRGQKWSDEKKERFKKMWLDGAHVDHIADEFATSPGAVYQRRKAMGLPDRPKKRKKRSHGSVAGGQRRKSHRQAGNAVQRNMQPWHPALVDGRTVFPGNVEPAARIKNLLKHGKENSKVGGMSQKGRWKGMEIYTLTLEERKTCPRTCQMWADCYGNNMHWPKRIMDDGTLMERLWSEMIHLDAICDVGFIVRLHVLGDFYSVEYVDFWCRALKAFPKLHIWGFTAWLPDTDIGRAVLEMMAANLDRVAMRVSGLRNELHCSVVADITKKDEVVGIVCPAEVDETGFRHCGNCGLCWTSEHSITFPKK